MSVSTEMPAASVLSLACLLAVYRRRRMLVEMSRVWTWWRCLVRPLTPSSARLVTELLVS